MSKLLAWGRLFVAVAMVVFGIQHWVYLNFVTRVFPKPPLWIPGQSLLAGVAGAFLIVAGVGIVAERQARTLALLLGGLILLSFIVLGLPAVLARPSNGGAWTSAGKALALAGASLLVASSLPPGLAEAAGWRTWLVQLIPAGRFFLASFFVLGGTMHFIYTAFVISLVPAWIPGRLFWAYFTGAALIAGGLGIMLPWTARLAATLSGGMIFLWVLVLHIPRALASPHNANELTAVFEALAMSGAALLVATTFPRWPPLRHAQPWLAARLFFEAKGISLCSTTHLHNH